MKSLKLLVLVLLFVSSSTIRAHAQGLPVDDTITNAGERVDQAKGVDDSVVQANISSTGSGGLWGSPSTWAGGVVPGAGDNVTISPGTAVLIDTDVTVANLTVGAPVSFNVGILTFEPFAPHTITVNGDLTIEGLGLLTTPTSNSTVTGHTITVGGNLTNSGVLDLSTNGNQAGAGLVFINASSNTFGGGGSLTDIRSITVNKGTSTANTLELTVLNFTVQGSSTDSPASGYLTLTNGTFKISGLFSGNHRTLFTAAYNIPVSAGFWLNNPNYTVAAQNGSTQVSGQLRISAGIFNQGTVSTNLLETGDSSGSIIVEGGILNLAGSVRRRAFSTGYSQTGGTLTACIAGNNAPCFNMGGTGRGGSIVIQTPNPVPNDSTPDFAGGFNAPGFAAITTVRFGNANTSGTGLFTSIRNPYASLAIDTTSGPHTVKLVGSAITVVKNIDIGPGGTLDIGDFQVFITGPTFVNNGLFKGPAINFMDPDVPTLPNFTYSGTGSFFSPLSILRVKGTSLTLDPLATPIRARMIQVNTAQINNSDKLILGLNDAVPSTILIEGSAAFDTFPTFDLGTGGQRLIYSNASSRNTGPEMNPTRQLVGLTQQGSGGSIVSIAGGDIVINGDLNLFSGIIDTGSYKLFHISGEATRTVTGFGFVRGTLIRRFNPSDLEYTFLVGGDYYAGVKVIPTSIPLGTVDVVVSPHDVTLPGLPSGTSASFSWDITQMGSMTSSLEASYGVADIHGNPSNYSLWRSIGGAPQIVASTSNPSAKTVTAPGLTDLTGSWGIGEPLTLITVSGRVLTSGGAPIRNASMTLTGGNLQLPLVTHTGSLGTYSFSGVEPGYEYTISVSAKRNRFVPSNRVITPATSVTNVNFIANPQE